MKEDEYKLLYETSPGRRLRGCMPLYFIVALALLLGLIYCLNVAMPQAPLDAGEGVVYYEEGVGLYQAQLQQSPLPFKLPRKVDPAENDITPLPLKLKREVSPAQAPPVSPFAHRPASAVLIKENLLALPPIPQSEGQEQNQAVESEPLVP